MLGSFGNYPLRVLPVPARCAGTPQAAGDPTATASQRMVRRSYSYDLGVDANSSGWYGRALFA